MVKHPSGSLCSSKKIGQIKFMPNDRWNQLRIPKKFYEDGKSTAKVGCVLDFFWIINFGLNLCD